MHRRAATTTSQAGKIALSAGSMALPGGKGCAWAAERVPHQEAGYRQGNAVKGQEGSLCPLDGALVGGAAAVGVGFPRAPRPLAPAPAIIAPPGAVFFRAVVG